MRLKKVFREIKNEITNYERYASQELKIIGYPGYERTDTIVAQKMSYSQWLECYTQWPVIKVEGLGSNKFLLKYFRKFRPKNIHLFYSVRTGTSFKWHRDDVNVFLFVVKGHKTVCLKSKRVQLNAGQGILLPKGHLHKVFSSSGTWALSIGF